MPSCLERDFLQPVEITQNVGPFGADRVPMEAIFEFLGQQQGEEGAEHVAANGDVAAVVDRTGGEDGKHLLIYLRGRKSIPLFLRFATLPSAPA